MAKRKSRRSSAGRGSKSGKWYTGNILLVMILRLLVVLLLLYLSRIVFYLFNLGYFSNLGIREVLRLSVIGLRFDLSALLIFNFPYILMNLLPFRFRFNRVYQVFANGFFYLINTFLLLSNIVDTIYFRFTLKRMTSDIFTYLTVGGDFGKLVPQFVHDFWYVGIVFAMLIVLMVFLTRRFAVSQATGKGGGFRYAVIHSFFLVILGGLAIIGIRGGLQLRPIGLVTPGNYTVAKNIPLVLNTPFSLVKSFNHEKLRTISWFRNENELAKVYTPVHQPKHTDFKNYNVMIIIMESFSREHIGLLNRELDNGRYQGFTPFMDSLIGCGFYFDAYANGKTSIQGIPAILSGIPSLMNESFIQSEYAAGKYTSIAGLLKPRGYATAFFHGGTNGTMGFDSYTKLVGFDHYYGRSEYHNEKDYDGKWGIRDEEFFQYTAKTINGMKQPFVAALFSLSSHHPYYVPSRYVNIFRTGKLPIQQSIMYADFSLGRFFHTVQHMPWYRNTLFVITADHTSEGYYPYYQSDIGQYAIPLLFFKPGSDLHGRGSAVAQQTDIMPTVLGYLGYDRKYLAYGNDLFDSTRNCRTFSVHYISGLYGLMTDGYYLEHNGNNCTSLFNISRDPMMKDNLKSKGNKKQEEIEHFFKAYLQQYNNRLIENRMGVE